MIQKARFINRFFVHPLQALGVFIVYGFFRILPLDWASAVGGFIGRNIGPQLQISRRATNNLIRVFPNMTPDQQQHSIYQMWDNLGRNVGEFPHLGRLGIYTENSRIDVVGKKWIEQTIDGENSSIFFTGHIGNWELVPLSMTALGTPIARVFREANNPLVNGLYHLGRRSMQGELIPKGATGARKLLRTLKQGGHVGMLVDQKMNDGISVPFLGLEAMTAPALAEMVLRYDCKVLPIRCERLTGAHFRITVLPPININKTGNRKQDVFNIMTDVNLVLERWIRDKPEQWLWLHNRWPK